MISSKVVSIIKSFLMAALAVMAFVGLGEWVPFIQNISTNIDVYLGAWTEIVELLLAAWALRPIAVSHTAGSLLKSSMPGRVGPKSSDKEQALYDVAEN